jgi:hypothetical protein
MTNGRSNPVIRRFVGSLASAAAEQLIILIDRDAC